MRRTSDGWFKVEESDPKTVEECTPKKKSPKAPVEETVVEEPTVAEETAPTTVKWGCMSTGAIANDFCRALKLTSNAELQAVASRSQQTADEFKEKHGFACAYDSYEKLAADPSVEIIYIATPHAFHCDNILMCLEAGKHVLCEKPMVVNAAQAERCIAKAKEKRRFLMEGMWTRFFPTTRAVRQLVRDGAIGKVIQVSASLGFKSEVRRPVAHTTHTHTHTHTYTPTA